MKIDGNRKHHAVQTFTEFEIVQWNSKKILFFLLSVFGYRWLEMIIDYTQKQISIINVLSTKVY